MSDIDLVVSASGPTVELTADAPGAVTVTVTSGGGVSTHAGLPDLATSGHPASVISGLGGAALLDVGSAAGTVAAGNDARIVGAAAKASNLSDLASASTARTNLGLGGAATLNVGTSAGTVAAGDDSRLSSAPALSQPASGLWWSTPGYADTVAVAGGGRMFAVPWVCPRAMTITRLGAEPATAGPSGAVMRLGIYTDNNGLPGSLVLDAGTINATSTTYQEITISQALAANTRYWFAMAAQGASGWNVRASRGGFSVPATYTASGNEYATVFVGSGVTGALPATFPTPEDQRAAAPRFTIKVA